jgi:hypothetical protein
MSVNRFVSFMRDLLQSEHFLPFFPPEGGVSRGLTRQPIQIAHFPDVMARSTARKGKAKRHRDGKETRDWAA